jgi:hypothetical protein
MTIKNHKIRSSRPNDRYPDSHNSYRAAQKTKTGNAPRFVLIVRDTLVAARLLSGDPTKADLGGWYVLKLSGATSEFTSKDPESGHGELSIRMLFINLFGNNLRHA